MSIFNIDFDPKDTGEDKDKTDPRDIQPRPVFGRKVKKEKPQKVKRQRARQIEFRAAGFPTFIERSLPKADRD